METMALVALLVLRFEIEGVEGDAGRPLKQTEESSDERFPAGESCQGAYWEKAGLLGGRSLGVRDGLMRHFTPVDLYRNHENCRSKVAMPGFFIELASSPTAMTIP